MAGTQTSNWAGKTYQEREWHHRQRAKMEQSWEEDAHTTGLPSAVSLVPDLHDAGGCAPSGLGLCLTSEPEAQIQLDMKPWAKVEIFILKYLLQGGKGRLTCPAALDSASTPLCSTDKHGNSLGEQDKCCGKTQREQCSSIQTHNGQIVHLHHFN